ncbi:MAG: prepilin-type N-terminal cleavage/methylation domain-containing protein [Acidobacteria bacterium]|nr:prepilin-type N-terminal cleavage/methylation domain-containing protein [Acidobacteriota bacterium]
MTKERGKRREARGEGKAGRQAIGHRPKEAAIRVAEPVIPYSALRVSHSALRVSYSAFRVQRSAGYTLVEMLVAVALFGIFLTVLVGLQGEFLRHDRSVRVALFSHPAPFAVLARLRRDILDSRDYPNAEGTWKQTPQTLLLEVESDEGKRRVVVWDFRDGSVARRLEFENGQPVAAWKARAVPLYDIAIWNAPGGRVGVRVSAKDKEGNAVVDQLVMPRAH